MSARRALITGITGQDGSLLADLLVDAGYEVYGVLRADRDPDAPLGHIEHLRGRVALDAVDLTDDAGISGLVAKVTPDELFHLGAVSVVARSWEEPLFVASVNGLAPVRFLEAVRTHSPDTHICFASSCEVFGASTEVPQREDTPLRPRSPYGAAKAYAQQMVAMTRARYGLHASSAILYNHEGPRRGPNFVTRRVTRGVAAIALGLERTLTVGNLDARRDWGRADDYVDAMRRIVAAPEPTDYILATGTSHSVRELVELAFAHVDVEMEGHIHVDPALVRADDGAQLLGDPTKAGERLGWAPRRDFAALVGEMVDADLAELRASTA